ILAWLRRSTGVRLLDVALSSYHGSELTFAGCRPDAYVTADRSLADLVRQQFPQLRVEIVPQSVDTDLFHPDGEALTLDLPRPIALIPGALAPEKSPELALRAVASSGVSALVAGSGPLASGIDTMATEILAPGRYFRVEVDRTEMPKIYRAADVVVLASPLESGALAVLEAMACGVPVVTTDDTVRRELVGDAGELVGGRDIGDFSAAIVRSLDRDWASQPRRRALEFSVTQAAERFGEILMSLAEMRR
ncbi:MAG: glycosyltransferase, partial [Acidobacteriota bacterium]